jgi:dihydrofolate reductase
MRKLIAEMAVSLDGFIEGPKGEMDWLEPLPSGVQASTFFNTFLSAFDTIFYGRVAYERFGVEGALNPSLPEEQRLLSSKANNMRKYVFSRKLKHVAGNGMVISNNVEAEVRRIKEEDGRDIWLCGGACITKSLSTLNLIDEYILAVQPVILGSGKPLFHTMTERMRLKLVDKKKLPSGIVLLRYNP